jgi:hypothetical protein
MLSCAEHETIMNGTTETRSTRVRPISATCETAASASLMKPKARGTKGGVASSFTVQKYSSGNTPSPSP